MKKFLQNWLISTLAVLVAVCVLRGRIHYEKWLDLVMASLMLGILNAVLRPILMLLTLPLLIFTLGLFRFVINALLLYLVSALLQPGFRVEGFWAAFWGALIISIVSVILNTLTGSGDSRVRFERRRRPPPSSPRPPGPGNGPVIDI
jgi:putative membrane protein